MTEQNTENKEVNISVEQILASIINTMGTITVPIEKLVENYGDRHVAVNQNEDRSVEFSLVEKTQE
ncbi:MAG: hypothetical protein RLZZ196_89 [Bacteroidota bacterium]|jgi:hypothetical protein